MIKTFFQNEILPLLSSAWQVTFLFAQEGNIKERVCNDYADLPAATVQLGNQKILTNDNGEFFISAKAGSYTMIATHVRY